MSIPLSAHDPRLLAAWQAGTTSPVVVASVPSDLPDPAHKARSNQLIKLSQLLHEVRTAAKREKAPGWESLFLAIQRKDYEDGRLVRIRIEPRSIATSALLDGIDLPAPTLNDAAPRSFDDVIPADILADVFGPLST